MSEAKKHFKIETFENGNAIEVLNSPGGLIILYGTTHCSLTSVLFIQIPLSFPELTVVKLGRHQTIPIKCSFSMNQNAMIS